MLKNFPPTCLYFCLFIISISSHANIQKDEASILKQQDNLVSNQIVPASSLLTHLKNKSIDNANCIKLKTISLDENTLFSPKQQNSLLSRYIGQCIDGKLIKTLITQVSEFYTNQGYITTKPYLKPQNIKSGQINIDVVVGYVEDVLGSEDSKIEGRITTAFIGQKNQPLNLRGIETALESINRVPSVDASFKIRPGKAKGRSIVAIDIKESSPYHVSFGVNGLGDLKDKNPGLNLIASIDNPLGVNDILSLTVNGSKIQKAYQSTKGKELNYSAPIGSYVVDWTSADTTYRQGVVGVNDTYLSNGKTKSHRFKLNKTLFRNQRNKWQTAFSLYHKNTKNYFANQPIEVSSYKTTLAQVDLTHTYLSNWGQWVNTYSYYQGVDWFGARDDNYLSAESDLINPATLEFKKYNIASNLVYYFSDKNYSLNSNFNLQYTKDTLYDNDKLTVGSSGTVRGYSGSSLFGNNAFYVKNDLSKAIKLDLDPDLLKTITPFVGLDYGKVRCQKDNINNCGEILGGAVGFRVNSNHLSADMTWSYPLKEISESFNKKQVFVFSINWKF